MYLLLVGKLSDKFINEFVENSSVNSPFCPAGQDSCQNLVPSRVPSQILTGCPGPSRPSARFWACLVVLLSQDNEGTSVPLSRKVSLSRPVGNTNTYHENVNKHSLVNWFLVDIEKTWWYLLEFLYSWGIHNTKPFHNFTLVLFVFWN